MRRFLSWLNQHFMMWAFWVHERLDQSRPAAPRCIPDETEAATGQLVETFRSDAFLKLLRHSAKCKSLDCKDAVYGTLFFASSRRVDNGHGAFCDIAQPIYDLWLRLEDARDFDAALSIMYPGESRSQVHG